MILFFVLAGALTLLALGFVLWPLVRSAKASSTQVLDRDASNAAIFRSQRREIDADLEAGRLDANEHRVALEELTARLASELGTEPTRPPGSDGAAGAKRPWWLIGGVSILLPIAAFAGYAQWGSPRAIQLAELVAKSEAAQSPDAANMTDKQVLALVESLAQKMAANPTDPRGWALLARAQSSLGQTAQALQAFERAVALAPGDADLLADYADALVVAADGRFEGKPYQTIQRALKVNPNNFKALALAGTAEMRMGNRKASLVAWEKLRSLLPSDSDDAKQVDAIIAEVKTGTAPMPPGNTVAMTGLVNVAPALRDKLQPGDTLFVLARAATGSVMPLAIVRVPLPSKWPFAFELTDAMAMAAGANLSSATEVIVEARISKSGTARLQPGDLVGRSLPIKPTAPNARGINLLIAEVVN